MHNMNEDSSDKSIQEKWIESKIRMPIKNAIQTTILNFRFEILKRTQEFEKNRPYEG